MDDPAMTDALGEPTASAVPCAAADTMRRVQDQLRRGVAPTYEALLAFGEPRVGRQLGHGAV
jgi:hypothetical protein